MVVLCAMSLFFLPMRHDFKQDQIYHFKKAEYVAHKMSPKASRHLWVPYHNCRVEYFHLKKRGGV